MSKLIVITGIDCSGKGTQTKLLTDYLNKKGKKVTYISFPNYNEATGKIIGGPCLGKEYIGKSYFKENFSNIDPKVGCLYYAADRRYMLPILKKLLNEFDYVITDRYIESNMAHQAGKIENDLERMNMYKWIEELEYNLLSLPKPDYVLFLHMPYKYAVELSLKREEKIDDVEKDINYLKNSERSYLELSNLYNYEKIECVENEIILTPLEIHKKIINIIEKNEGV